MARQRRVAAVVVAVLGLIAAGALYFSASDVRKAAGQHRSIELEYVSDTPTEDVRNVVVYISGHIENPLRVFPGVHLRFDLIAQVHPDQNGRVSLRVPYYHSYKAEVFLPREDWGDPRGIQVHVEHLYGLGGAPDGRVRATLELATARTFEYR